MQLTPLKLLKLSECLSFDQFPDTLHFKAEKKEAFVPPSVVISQNALNALPLPSGSIQYSPSPVESPACMMCLQDLAALVETDPKKAMGKKLSKT